MVRREASAHRILDSATIANGGRIRVLFAAALAVGLGIPACSEPFESCEARRRCPLGGAGGMETGQSGAATSAGVGGIADESDGGAGGPSPATAGATGAGGSAEGGAAGAAGSGGLLGECEPDQSRFCREGGAIGACASGIQTCTGVGEWGPCSIQPAPQDSCEEGNNDNCSGPPNEGCSCVNGVTSRPCGPCNDGIQICTNGKAGQFGACTGAVLVPVTYYRDADGDGFGSSATATVCSGTKPSGYSDQTGDCCDDGGDVALAAKIHPGQAEFFETPANLCNVTWNYDCSSAVETDPPSHGTGCLDNTSAPACVKEVTPFNESSCGQTAVECGCGATSQNACTTGCGSSYTVKCH